jgi:hypothetical protein
MALLDELTETQKKYIGYATQQIKSDVDLGAIIEALIAKCNELEGRLEVVEGG